MLRFLARGFIVALLFPVWVAVALTARTTGANGGLNGNLVMPLAYKADSMCMHVAGSATHRPSAPMSAAFNFNLPLVQDMQHRSQALV